ncbi:unnamed protein product [Tuber aestivum]|uniref:Uncharacterized protein n=1 Tax=Tuber aestivum TaxID=59557 RepID=A0A292Q2F1_9PEZI|nr:unnamed protein product [Tuber aestivum]
MKRLTVIDSNSEVIESLTRSVTHEVYTSDTLDVGLFLFFWSRELTLRDKDLLFYIAYREAQWKSQWMTHLEHLSGEGGIFWMPYERKPAPTRFLSRKEPQMIDSYPDFDKSIALTISTPAGLSQIIPGSKSWYYEQRDGIRGLPHHKGPSSYRPLNSVAATPGVSQASTLSTSTSVSSIGIKEEFEDRVYHSLVIEHSRVLKRRPQVGLGKDAAMVSINDKVVKKAKNITVPTTGNEPWPCVVKASTTSKDGKIIAEMAPGASEKEMQLGEGAKAGRITSTEPKGGGLGMGETHRKKGATAELGSSAGPHRYYTASWRASTLRGRLASVKAWQQEKWKREKLLNARKTKKERNAREKGEKKWSGTAKGLIVEPVRASERCSDVLDHDHPAKLASCGAGGDGDGEDVGEQKNLSLLDKQWGCCFAQDN